MASSAAQKEHFERLHDLYERHYYDRWSLYYRNEFLYPPLWDGLDLNGKRVAELACGSGHNSKALLTRYPQAELVGFDISPRACAAYRQNTGFPAVQLDLTRPLNNHFQFDQFDAVFIIGGLHHCVVDLRQSLLNVARMLKTGGVFMMNEPNSQYFLEFIRNVWYRLDNSFESGTEHALNHKRLLEISENTFECINVDYLGGPAYFGVLNSMILRVPLRLKPIVSPPLIALERVWNRIPLTSLQNVFVARWRRTDVTANN